MDIKEISKRNYEATKKRGLITKNTDCLDFISKIDEELDELNESTIPEKGIYVFDKKELADIVLVCFAMAEHFGIDLLKEMENKTIYNENRTD